MSFNSRRYSGLTQTLVTQHSLAEGPQKGYGILVFLDDPSLLDPFLSCFLPGHGTEMALVALTDDLWRHLDRGGSGLLLLLDLTAVFDTVSYDLLTHCLPDTRIWGTALQWLTSFHHR